MKRIITLVFTLLFLLPTLALADNMMVVNCDEWVSLRETPSTSAKRLMKVPLDAVVTDCEWTDSSFTRCTYEGVTGYILDKYLEPIEANEPDDALLDTWVHGMNVYALRNYEGDGERLTVVCYGADGGEMWRFDTGVADVTELDATDAFIGGTAEDPRGMVFNAREGLYSLDIKTGGAVWMLSEDEADLGAGIAHAVDADGTMYISGYYGPDPVCVDMGGNVLWQSSAGSDDIYWPYEIRVEDRGIVTQYSMMDDQGTEGRVIYDKNDGHVVDIEFDR